MAYIGKQPTVGNFVKLDSITTSATATYNLLNGGVAYSPQSANHCIVSLNGVIQSPTTSFTISGSTIVFASALTATDVIDFILVLGDVLNIGTPSDATVGFAKVTSNLITGATAETSIAGGDSVLIYDDSASALRKMTRTNFVSGLSNTPAFLAYISADQTITDSTFTKAQFNTEVFDVGSCYDNATNYRFTPNVAGKYMIFSNLQMELGDYGIYQVQTVIKKNGSDYANIKAVFNTTVLFGIHAPIQHIIEFNGTTDYVEIFGYIERHSSTGNKFENGTKASFFGGYKIIE